MSVYINDKLIKSGDKKKLSNKSINKNDKYRYKFNRKLKKSKKEIYGEESDSDSDSDSSYSTNNLYGCPSVNVADNNIYFRSAVNKTSVDELIRTIQKKNEDFVNLVKNNKMINFCQPKPLYLYITSYGGCLLSCFRAIDAIRRSAIPIYTVVDGYAASAATLMSVVGRKRFMTPHSYMLIHQLSSGVMGKYWEIEDEFINLEMMMNDIYKIYTDNSTMKKDELEEQLSHDLWWGAETCLSNGLIDEIYDRDAVIENKITWYDCENQDLKPNSLQFQFQ